jgi:hypothetical protein
MAIKVGMVGSFGAAQDVVALPVAAEEAGWDGVVAQLRGDWAMATLFLAGIRRGPPA